MGRSQGGELCEHLKRDDLSLKANVETLYNLDDDISNVKVHALNGVS